VSGKVVKYMGDYLLSDLSDRENHDLGRHGRAKVDHKQTGYQIFGL